GRETRLDVQLSAGNRVSGMVVTESGAAVPEADVEAMTAGGASRRGKTDASGRFEFDSLSPARYQFNASKIGYADGVVRDLDGAAVTFFPKPGSSQQTQAMVTADDQGNYTATGLDDGDYSVIVADSKRFASYNTTYTVRGGGTFDIDYTAQPLRGRVIDSTGNDPINEANITLRATGGSGLSMRFGDRLTATDTNGTFNLDLVPSGTYTVTASKQGYG